MAAVSASTGDLPPHDHELERRVEALALGDRDIDQVLHAARRSVGALAQQQRMAEHRQVLVRPEVEMPEPQLLVGHRQQGVDRLALFDRHLHLERTGQVHHAEFGMPAEPHPILAPMAVDLGRQLVVVLPVERPFVGDRDLLDEVDRIAGGLFGL